MTQRVRSSNAWIAVAAVAASQAAVAAAGATPAPTPPSDASVKNGARIYYSAVSDRGTPIRYSGGPDLGVGMMGGGMMGGAGQWLTCASCHGPQARGGLHVMHMRAMYAPDIRFSALARMPEMKGQAHPYGIDEFRQSVEAGHHPDGDELSTDMPRWQMSEADLRDLFAFLQRLPN